MLIGYIYTKWNDIIILFLTFFSLNLQSVQYIIVQKQRRQNKV